MGKALRQGISLAFLQLLVQINVAYLYQSFNSLSFFNNTDYQTTFRPQHADDERCRSFFSLDPKVLREGTSEIFINLEKCQKVLTENKELLLDFLKEYQPIVEKLLGSFGSTYTYKNLVGLLEKAVSDERSDQNGFYLNKCARVAFQHTMFGLFQSVNLHQYIPRAWIPPLSNEWVDETYEHPPYPPKKWVQICDHERVIKQWQQK